MNKLAVIVPFYKREILTRLCFENLKRQQKKFGFDVYTCGSEGDVSKSLALEFGFNYVESKNNPLSSKNNTLIKSTKNKDYDGIIIVGSDDFSNNTLFYFYSKMEIKQGYFYGFDDIFFYDVAKKGMYTNGVYKHNDITIGAYRLYSVELLKKLKYNLWNVDADSGLDSLASSNCVGKEIKLSASENKVIIVDVKYELNITDPSIINTCEPVNISNLNKLGVISKKLLSLKPSKNRKVIGSKVEDEVAHNSIRVVLIGDWVNYFGCTEKTLERREAMYLISKGIAKIK